MSLEDIWQFAPDTWSRQTEIGLVSLSQTSEEYTTVENDLKKATTVGINKRKIRISSIRRYQNIYDFGQFMLRGQILCTEHPETQYYEVRRYVEIQRSEDKALEHNLDHRWLDHNNALLFSSHLSLTGLASNSTIFVVKILTTNPTERVIKPYNFTEYYIEYVAKFEFDNDLRFP